MVEASQSFVEVDGFFLGGFVFRQGGIHVEPGGGGGGVHHELDAVPGGVVVIADREEPDVVEGRHPTSGHVGEAREEVLKVGMARVEGFPGAGSHVSRIVIHGAAPLPGPFIVAFLSEDFCHEGVTQDPGVKCGVLLGPSVVQSQGMENAVERV